MIDELTFSLTGRDLEAVQHLADDTAADYFARAGLEPMRTSSRGTPNFRKVEGGRRERDGWRVTFVYRSRPGPDPVPSRLRTDAEPGPVKAARRDLAERLRNRPA